jgi:hypothetical protein
MHISTRRSKNHVSTKLPALHRKPVIASSHGTKLNRLLAALPDAELKHWLPELELIELPLGKVLYESGGIEKHVYFPTSAIVSLLYVMKNGDAAEIAVVGNEGIVGISLFMGGNSTPSRAVVQSGGRGYRLDARIMKNEFERSGPVTHLLLRYTQALITQMSQTAVSTGTIRWTRNFAAGCC